MREYLKRLPREILDLIYLAKDLAKRKNMPAYLVGGFVRDLILGVKNFDLDLVIEGNGISFGEELSHALNSKLVLHKRFGTATVIVDPALKIDIASARREFYPHPAHLPIVESSNLKDDHFRRDFTINAMAIDISDDNFGKLLDFFGGVSDLKNKKIRFLHTQSFIDDPTRILRAIRFEKRYNFKIEARTLRYLKQAVKLKMLQKLEPQRVMDEIILVLKEDRPVESLKRIDRLVGFEFITPKLLIGANTYRLLGSINRIIESCDTTYPKHRKIESWLMYFMGLIDLLSLNDTKLLCQKFSFNKADFKRIISYKKIKPSFIRRLGSERFIPSEIYHLLSPLSYEVVLLLKAKCKSKKIQKRIRDFFKKYHDVRISTKGDDLQRLGIKPGPGYQNIFKKLLDAKLNGLLKDKEAEIRLIKKIIK